MSAAGPRACGFAAPGWEAVAHEFERNLADRGDRGAAFAAVADGVPIVDLWGGIADEARGSRWRRDTLAGIFSGTKGLVAACVLRLVERGALELDRPVRAYWPEFAAHGKQGVLVRHVVSHRAGLPGLTTPVTPRAATDATRMASLLAAQAPICTPGSRFHYHALTFGWLCGELVRRVDGRSVGRYFHEEVAAPLGLDAWIGLPPEHDERVATLEPGPGFGERAPGSAPEHEGIHWSTWENPPRFTGRRLPANERYWRAAEVPASNGVATARAVARLYGCLARGGEVDGVRVLSPATIALGTTRLTSGVEPSVHERMAFGVGFELQADARLGPARVAFGHTGTGGSVHGAWPEAKIGFSYVTSTLLPARDEDPRARALLRALHESSARGARVPPGRAAQPR